MRFEIKRSASKDIEVFKFDIVEKEKKSIWKHWKLMGTVAVLSAAISISIFAMFCEYDFSNINVEVKSDRSTTVILRSDNEQKEGNSQGSDGIAPSIN